MELSNQYVAGLFDGEGHVSITYTKVKTGKNPKLCVKLTNTFLPVLKELHKKYGGCITANKKQAEHYLQCYVLNFTVAGSKKFLTDVLPYLVIKKRQAEIALKFSATVYRRGKHRVTYEEIAIREECMRLVAEDKQIQWTTGENYVGSAE